MVIIWYCISSTHSIIVNMANNVKKFWGSYRKAVIATGVPENNAEWYVRWAQKFSRSFTGKSLEERSVSDIRQFLVEFSMQNGIQPWQVQQAEDSLVFLYDTFLKTGLRLKKLRPLGPTPAPSSFHPYKRTNFRDRMLPRAELDARYKKLFDRLKGVNLLMAGLLYGAGLRLMECIRLLPTCCKTALTSARSRNLWVFRMCPQR
jgi:integrase